MFFRRQDLVNSVPGLNLVPSGMVSLTKAAWLQGCAVAVGGAAGFIGARVAEMLLDAMDGLGGRRLADLVQRGAS